MSAPLFLAMLIYATSLWEPSSAVRQMYSRYTHLRIQDKLKFLIRELVQDCEMKVRAVQHYRDQYYKSLQFQLGDIVYEMRDYYKRMARLFQLTDRNISYGHIDHNENIRTYLEIRRMGIEIENKVAMVREWQFRRAGPEEHHIDMEDPLRSGAGHEYESQELLHEGVARARIARAWRASRPPPRRPSAPRSPVPGDSPKRKNKKWKYVRSYPFV